MAEENKLKVLVKKFYDEVWNKGNMSAADIFSENYIRHDLRPGNPPPGPEGQKKIAADFRKAFPDLRITITLMIAEGDIVVARWVMTGTHNGQWGNVAPTGRKAEFSGVNIFRFSNGKVVEIWNYRDDLGLREQLGVPIYAGNKD